MLLLLLVAATTTATDSNFKDRNLRHCAQIKCTECLGENLVCNLPGIKKIPAKGIVTDFYKYVDIAYALFTDPTLHKDLFTKFKRVVTLKLTYCNVFRIREYTFQELRKLTDLYLNNNNLGIIENYAFYGLNLESLLLDENIGITLARRAFDGLTVKILSLTRSRIKHLTYETFHHLFTHLKMFLLTGNKLSTISSKFEKHLANVNKLRVLTLGANPIQCDCDNLWLIRVLQFRQINEKMSSKYLQPKTMIEMFPQCSGVINQSVCFQPYIRQVSVTFFGCNVLLKCVSSGNDASKIQWVNENKTTLAGTIIAKDTSTLFVKRNQTIHCRLHASSVAIRIGGVSTCDSSFLTWTLLGFIIIVMSCLATAVSSYWSWKQRNKPKSEIRFIETSPPPPHWTNLLQPIPPATEQPPKTITFHADDYDYPFN